MTAFRARDWEGAAECIKCIFLWPGRDVTRVCRLKRWHARAGPHGLSRLAQASRLRRGRRDAREAGASAVRPVGPAVVTKGGGGRQWDELARRRFQDETRGHNAPPPPRPTKRRDFTESDGDSPESEHKVRFGIWFGLVCVLAVRVDVLRVAATGRALRQRHVCSRNGSRNAFLH